MSCWQECLPFPLRMAPEVHQGSLAQNPHQAQKAWAWTPQKGLGLGREQRTVDGRRSVCKVSLCTWSSGEAARGQTKASRDHQAQSSAWPVQEQRAPQRELLMGLYPPLCAAALVSCEGGSWDLGWQGRHRAAILGSRAPSERGMGRPSERWMGRPSERGMGSHQIRHGASDPRQAERHSEGESWGLDWRDTHYRGDHQVEWGLFAPRDQTGA